MHTTAEIPIVANLRKAWPPSSYAVGSGGLTQVRRQRTPKDCAGDVAGVVVRTGRSLALYGGYLAAAIALST